jgi:hypothetical protein
MNQGDGSGAYSNNRVHGAGVERIALAVEEVDPFQPLSLISNPQSIQVVRFVLLIAPNLFGFFEGF